MATRSSQRLLTTALSLSGILIVRALLRKARAYDLRGKVVLLTGGSRGLGLVLARQLAAEGAKLALCARTEDQLYRAADELTALGAEVLAVPADVARQSDVNDLLAQVRARFGRIDVLINNAGVMQVGPYENMTLHEYAEVMNINFFGPLHLMLGVLPEMQARRAGRIVNIASVGGKVGVPHLLPYTASKFALGGFSKGLRAEVARHGVVVTTVFPGVIRTGSPRNMVVKGQHEREYFWFKTTDSLPLLTGSAESAAGQIVEALKTGRAELVITWPGKLVSVLNELFPEFTADAFAFINRFLPGPVAGGALRRKGYEVETPDSHRGIPALSDEAARRNNEF